MAHYVKTGGSWREVSQPYVKVGGTWRTVSNVYVKTGGTWREVWAAGGGGPVVSMSSFSVYAYSTVAETYAQVRYSTTGEEFENSSDTLDNFSSSRGDWLTSGTASDCYIERTVNSGSLNYRDFGATRLQMTANRELGVRDLTAIAGYQTANVTVRMYDAASGGTQLDSVTYVVEAEYTSACPKCCFTPDTPIMMADGKVKPIELIKEGELIANQSGGEAVTKIIKRKDRRMVKLTFSDGRTLTLSVDHPIHVDDKGPCAVEPEANYKGHTTRQLEIGDWATLASRLKIKLVSIEQDPYRDEVYTFENRLFYANGILVY